jgi:hypothetical protein
MGVELITKKKNLNFKQDKDNIELKTPAANIKIDDEVIEDSKNAVSGGAVYDYVDIRLDGFDPVISDDTIKNIIVDTTRDEILIKRESKPGMVIPPSPARHYPVSSIAVEDYVKKNREYNAYGEVTSKEITFPTAEGYHSFSGRLGIVNGETYTIETIVDDEVVHTYEEIGYPDMSGIGSNAYSVGMEVLVSDDGSLSYCVLVDGVDYDVDAGEFEYCDNYVIESFGDGADYVDNVTVRITGKFIIPVPIESLPVRSFLIENDYFIPTTGAVSKSIKSLEDRVAQKVSNFNVVKASNSIPFGFPSAGTFNRADIKLVGFVNGKTDVLFDVNVNHSNGNGDVHILDESGYVVRYLNITPDEIKGTTGTYYCVLDIQELTMSNGVVHTKIKNTFYKYEDGSTTHKEGLANQVYTKEIDTIFFYAGRSSFSVLPKGGLIAADEENTSFTEFRGKACYYKL